MSGLEIIAGVGTLVNAVGQISGANAQADAARKQAVLKNQQADELLSREAINEQILHDEAKSEMLSGAHEAGGGSEGGGIGQALTIVKTLNQTIANNQRDAEFKAKMLRAGAEMDQTLASDYQVGGILKSGGTLLSGAGDIYKANMQPPSSTLASLPKNSADIYTGPSGPAGMAASGSNWPGGPLKY